MLLFDDYMHIYAMSHKLCSSMHVTEFGLCTGMIHLFPVLVKIVLDMVCSLSSAARRCTARALGATSMACA